MTEYDDTLEDILKAVQLGMSTEVAARLLTEHTQAPKAPARDPFGEQIATALSPTFTVPA